MAYTTINKSSEHFENKIWTGNGSSQNITGLNFKPDFVWIKDRDDASSHAITDAVRGNTKYLMSNGNDAEETLTDRVTSFNSDGYSLGSSAGVNQNGAGNVGWNWKANGQGSANTVGDINSTVSVNTTAGFSIVKWTGNNTAGNTVGHGLGAVPKVVIIKRLDTSASWISKFNVSTDGYLYLHTADAISSSSGWLPTSSTTFTLANQWTSYNASGGTYIAYCFAEKTGYSKFGSYVGNDVADGTFVYTGFKPAFVMLKKSSQTSDWLICDNKRNPSNGVNKKLFPNLSQSEDSYDVSDFVSNGFKIRTNSGAINASGQTYIYMAFAEAPLVGTNNVPCTAR